MSQNKKNTISEEEITRKILAKIDSLNEEAAKQKNEPALKAIAITDDIKFGNRVLSNQIDEFRASVNPAAEFAQANPENPAESPLIYMPKTGNVVFSGTIPPLNNLEFQFVLKTNTGNGCFVWADGLIINKENMKVLERMQGYYENWKESWLTGARELDSLKNME